MHTAHCLQCTMQLHSTGVDCSTIKDTNSSFLDDMRACSTTLGVSQQNVISLCEEMSGIIKQANSLDQAFSLLLPRNESLKQYKNPCWRVNGVTLSRFTRNMILNHLTRISMKFNISQHEVELITDQTIRSHHPPYHDWSSRADQSLMCLPSFFVPGFPKSGTTTLHNALRQHPQISGPVYKETHWLTNAPISSYSFSIEGLKAAVLTYSLNFNSLTEKKNAAQLLTYDASQSLLYNSNFLQKGHYQDFCVMPALLSRTLPKARFIIMMRNPIQRMYSHYLYKCKIQHRTIAEWPKYITTRPARAFHNKALIATAEFTQCLHFYSAYECANSMLSACTCGEVGCQLSSSLYYIHIVKWLQFFPREQFLFLRTEDMKSFPIQTMNKITAFLDIDSVPDEMAKKMLSKLDNNREKINQQFSLLGIDSNLLNETIALLSEFFRPFNRQLTVLMGDMHYMWNDILG